MESDIMVLKREVREPEVIVLRGGGLGVEERRAGERSGG